MILLDCEWIHETFWGEAFCSVLILGGYISTHQFLDQWYPWDFVWNEVWTWYQKVALLILCPPWKMSCGYEYCGEQWSERQVDLIGEWSCLPLLFLLLPDFLHITLKDLLWGNQLIFKICNPVFIYTCVHFSCFCIGNDSGWFRFFCSTSQWRYHWKVELLRWQIYCQKKISCMICVTVCVNKVEVFLVFNLWTTCFEEALMWDII